MRENGIDDGHIIHMNRCALVMYLISPAGLQKLTTFTIIKSASFKYCSV